MTSKKKRFTWKNLLVFTISLLLALCAGEWIYRRILFGGEEAFDKYRKPGLYSHEGSPDYWALQDMFNPNPNTRYAPHPWLGWAGGFFNSQSYLHDDFLKARNKRPVLLYGDSFAMGVDQSSRFQEILNADTVFTKGHYLLNYGMGGYGLDQIQILMHQTAYRYHKPFIIFSLLTEDIERSGLPLRVSLKPYYEMEGDSLVLRGVPVSIPVDSFIKEHPPEIRSYLWRRLIFGTGHSWMPESIDRRLKGTTHYYEQKSALNAAILDKVLAELKTLDCDYFFLVFQRMGFAGVQDPNDQWRVNMIKDWLDRNQVPHFFTGPILDADSKATGRPYGFYAIEGDGHPTTEGNRVIGEFIKTEVLKKQFSWNDSIPLPGEYEYEIRATEALIRKSPLWFDKVRAGALEAGIPVDVHVRRNAIYMLNTRQAEFRR